MNFVIVIVALQQIIATHEQPAEAIGRGGDYLPFLTEIVAELNGVKPLKTTTG